MQTETVRAGAMTAVLTDGDLRYLTVDGHEIVRRVYAAVRAADWATIPATLTVREKTVSANAFHVVYNARYTDAGRGIDYEATLALTGDATGRICCDFDGAALADFERARIGICVLHPADAKNAPVTVTHTNGDIETGAFPDTISPHQPFFDTAAIRHTAAPGLDADVSFTGDVFEMEDQRNWLDASFKTYSTPLSLPLPARVRTGERVRQSVVITVQQADGNHDTPITRSAPGSPTKTASVGVVYHDAMIAPGYLLPALPNLHLWVSLDPANNAAPDWLRRADRVAARCNAALFIHVSNADDTDRFASLAALVSVPVRWFVSPDAVVPGNITPFAVGYPANFTELNRARPYIPFADGYFFAANPQVHATDDISVMEAPSTIADCIRTARTFTGNAPVHVGPLTFTAPHAPPLASPPKSGKTGTAKS